MESERKIISFHQIKGCFNLHPAPTYGRGTRGRGKCAKMGSYCRGMLVIVNQSAQPTAGWRLKVNRGIPIPLRSATIVLQRVGCEKLLSLELYCRRYSFPWLVLLEILLNCLVGRCGSRETKVIQRPRTRFRGESISCENEECLDGDGESDNRKMLVEKQRLRGKTFNLPVGSNVHPTNWADNTANCERQQGTGAVQFIRYCLRLSHPF